MPEAEGLHIKLDQDKTAVLTQQIKEVTQALSSLLYFLDTESGLPQGTARDIVSVTEHRFQEIGQILNVPTESNERIEKRSQDIRKANIRIRELETMLGNAQDPQAIQMAIKALSDQLYGWWRLEGFGHVSDLAFGEYNLKATFSCHLFGDFALIGSKTPVSDKERRKLWLDSLRARGFVINQDGREKRVEDCPQTRDALKALFAERLPGASIWKFDGHETKGGSEMTSVTVVIRRLEEIKSLPVAPEVDDD